MSFASKLSELPEGALRLRPITADDLAFLFAVYAGTRATEMEQVAWSAAQKEAFLRMQFEAQHAYYQEHYRNTSFDLIVLNDQPIGRLYLARWEAELRIVDIALLPEYRGQGIGTALLRAIMDEALQRGLPVRIHVELFNPALTLYARLGFRVIGENGPYYFMEWSSGRSD